MIAPAAIVVMGVSGCGKTSIGSLIAERVDGVFVDADTLHPESNIAKMAAGTPLDDDDRWPWLDRVAAALAEDRWAGASVVVACSALRRAYRDRLRAKADGIFFVHLDGPRDTILARMDRPGHFMPASLLDSQFATLERLGADESGIRLDVRDEPDELATRALAEFASLQSSPH